MSDQPDNSKPQTSPEDLDHTRVNIPYDPNANSAVEMTQSQISLEPDTNHDVAISKTNAFLSRLPFKKIGQWFKNRKASFEFKKPTTPINVNQTLRNLARHMGFAVLAAPVFWLWYKSLAFALAKLGGERWGLVAIAGFSTLFLIIALVKRWHPLSWSSIPWAGFLLSVFVGCLLFPSTQTQFITILGKAPGYLLNELWLFIVLTQILWLLLVFPQNRFLKLAFGGLWILGLGGLVANIWGHVPLEASFRGSLWLTALPLHYLQPVYLLLQVILPLWVFLSLFSKTSFHRWNLLPLFVVWALGWLLLQQQAVPNLLSTIQKPKPALGTLEWQDPSHRFLLETKHRADDFLEDNKPRLEFSRVSNSGSQAELVATGPTGFPMLFLKQSDLKLIADGKEVQGWKWILKRNKQEFVYLLSLPNLPASSPTELKAIPTSLETSEPQLILDHPIANEAVGASTVVACRLLGINREALIRISMDGNQIAEKNTLPCEIELDLATIAEGEHELKITAQLENAPSLEQSIKIQRKPEVPSVSIAWPTFGEYLPLQGKVQLQTSDDTRFTKLELKIENTLLKEWNAPPFETEWNTEAVNTDFPTLRVIGTTTDGLTVSDWVYASAGMGEVKVLVEGQENLPSDQTGMGFDRVAFILDASQSMRDAWDFQTKWEALKRTISAPGIKNRLGGAEVRYFVTGSQKHFREMDCNDVIDLEHSNGMKRQIISSAIRDVTPQGLPSYSNAFKKALAFNPQKIIVFTDGTRQCLKALPEEVKRRLTDVSLDVIAIGSLSDTQTKAIEKWGVGKIKSVADSNALQTLFAQLLKRTFELELGEKKVWEGAFDGKPHPLREGKYMLKIPSNLEFTPKEIEIKKGKTTQVTLKPRGQNWDAVVSE